MHFDYTPLDVACSVAQIAAVVFACYQWYRAEQKAARLQAQLNAILRATTRLLQIMKVSDGK